MYKLTESEIEAIQIELLDLNKKLCVGKGSFDGEKCTVSALNFALTGRLTDKPHPCMSPVVVSWVICVQDMMPDSLRNSIEWRKAALGIAGSKASIAIEEKRVALILDWMWATLDDKLVTSGLQAEVLPAWQKMLTEKTTAAASTAANAANVAYAANAANAAANAAAANVAYAAANAANAVAYATYATYAANAAYAAANAAANVAAYAAANVAAYAANAAFWARRNLVALLQKLTTLSD